MTQPPIRFDDGAAYDRSMGAWSRLAGDVFLDWLAPASGLRWLDVGCGSGAFSARVLERAAPAELQGIDPSAAQIDFAASRVPGGTFQVGDAMALPFPADRFDVAIMALVIFFVPDPAKGVAEMARAVRPGGQVAAYAWNINEGGFPFRHVQAAAQTLGATPVRPPSAGAERMEALQALWQGAGLESIETHTISVRRSFADFEAYWQSSTVTGGTRALLAKLSEAERGVLRDRVNEALPRDEEGRISYLSHANAIKGRVPSAR